MPDLGFPFLIWLLSVRPLRPLRTSLHMMWTPLRFSLHAQHIQQGLFFPQWLFPSSQPAFAWRKASCVWNHWEKNSAIKRLPNNAGGSWKRCSEIIFQVSPSFLLHFLLDQLASQGRFNQISGHRTIFLRIFPSLPYYTVVFRWPFSTWSR